MRRHHLYCGSRNASTSSLLQQFQLYASGSNAITVGEGEGGVEALPFRGIVGDGISRVRFAKIDIEGPEAPVLSAILEALPELPDDLIVASEVSPTSAGYVEHFTTAGFRA